MFLSPHCSPADSSRFGSSGNLSQTSSQLSETGQESTGGSELEETFHSFHNTGLHPSVNGQPRTNGHSNGGEIHRLSPEIRLGLKKDPPAERGSSKLLRYMLAPTFSSFLCAVMKMHVIWETLSISVSCHWHRFHDDGPPLPFSPSRVRWLKAINKVRVQLREVGRLTYWFFHQYLMRPSCFVTHTDYTWQKRSGWVEPLWLLKMMHLLFVMQVLDLALSHLCHVIDPFYVGGSTHLHGIVTVILLLCATRKICCSRREMILPRF